MCTLVAKSGDPWYYVMDKDKGKDDSSKMKRAAGTDDTAKTREGRKEDKIIELE